MSLDCDDHTHAGSAIEGLGKKFEKALVAAGLILPSGAALKKYAEDAGFVDVVVHDIKQPWGPWPKNPEMKKVGQIMALTAVTGLEVCS